MGLILQEKGLFDEAEEYYQKALQINPYHEYTYNNLGALFKENGQLDKAMQCYRKALQLNPHNAEIHFGYSLAFLLSGNFQEGFKEYEWRWRTSKFIPYHRDYSQPAWDGSDIKGKTIAIHAEQGFGDTIQFVRYTSLIAARGAKILLICQNHLASLFKNVEGVHQVIGEDEELPSFDFHCPLLSLPLLCKTTLDTIPAKVPYIAVEPRLVQQWKEKLHDRKLRIGLSWAGNPQNERDHLRSCPLSIFSPLSQLDDIVFYSLQKEIYNKTVNHAETFLIDLTEEIKDFADTAAIIESLDLVISVDTAVVHLAGALGKPIRILIPYSPDWRWMLDRKDSPWYPSMRLFRQPSFGDWESVIADIKDELLKIRRRGEPY